MPRDKGIFWVPLIALYTGARSGEIIQLYVDDIKEKQDVLYFTLNLEGEDKRLKTSGSERLTPVHPDLVEMGLLKHVEARRTQGELRLFPEMSMGADGYYSSPYPKHYGRFLESINVKKKGKNSFHSFRHNFEDACRDSGISKGVMDALQGHREDGMSGRYGRGYRLQKLEEMRRLHYRDLDLEHLMVEVC